MAKADVMDEKMGLDFAVEIGFEKKKWSFTLFMMHSTLIFFKKKLSILNLQGLIFMSKKFENKDKINIINYRNF